MKRSDIATEKLINLITVDKKFLPGEKIPNEQTLAALLNVSRNTVRTAVRYLVGQGVLEIRIGKGTFVAEDSTIFDDFGFSALRYSHLKMRDLYELRLMLEPQMAYYAATRATDEELSDIIHLGIELQQHSGQHSDDSKDNEDFHLAIVKASHNEFGVTLWKTLNQALRQTFEENQISQSITDFYSDHEMIIKYLQMRDPAGAQLAMNLHLKNSMSFYHL